MKTFHKVFVVSAFFSVLFIQHPNFLQDLRVSVRASFSDVPSWSTMVSFVILSYVLFKLGKKYRRALAAKRLAGGVGLRLHDEKSMGWIVIEVVPEGPGDLKGIQIGDCITHVDGISVVDLKSFSVIRGPIGSDVALRIKRGLPGSADVAAKVLEKGALDGQSERSHMDSASPVITPDNTSVDESAVDEVTLILERKVIRPQPQAPDATIASVENNAESEKKKDD